MERPLGSKRWATLKVIARLFCDFDTSEQEKGLPFLAASDGTYPHALEVRILKLKFRIRKRLAKIN